MKFTVNLECSPEEARAFFGLPDVQPLQEAMMREMQERIMQNLRVMDQGELMKQWMPLSLQAFDNFQKMFWSQNRV